MYYSLHIFSHNYFIMYLIFSAVLLNIPGFVIVGILACFGGVIAFAYYAKVNCDPMTGGQITNPNQVRRIDIL